MIRNLKIMGQPTARYIFGKIPIHEGKLRSETLPDTTRDGVFKMMFQTEKTKEFACYFFSKFLDMDFEYLKDNMILYKNVFSKAKLARRERTGDFIGKIGDCFISFEMNNTNTLERNVEYAHLLYSDFASSKDKKNKQKYRCVIQFNANNFTLPGIRDTIRVSYASDGEYMRVMIIYIDIYLPLITEKYEKHACAGLTEQEKVVLAMFAGKDETIKELIRGDEELMKYYETRKKLKEYDPLFRAYDHQKADLLASYEEGQEMGYKLGTQQGEMRGLKLGEKRGLKLGQTTEKEENAKKMILKDFSLEDIIDITGLTTNRIHELKDELYIIKQSNPLLVEEPEEISDYDGYQNKN